MSLSLISWFVALFLLANAAWEAWRAFHTNDSTPRLLLAAVFNVAITLLVANMATLHWNSVVPLWLWWLIAALLAVYLGGLTWRVLTRGATGATASAAPRRSPTA